MKLRNSTESGLAVMAVLGLLGILSLFVLVNARTIARLKHDVRAIEQRQLQRLATAVPAQISNPVTNVSVNLSLTPIPSAAP